MDGLLPVLALLQLLLKAGGHQDGVVHRSAQLDGTDTDGGDERQRLAQHMGQAQIDEDSQLDDGDQDEGQGEASSVMMRKMAAMEMALTTLKS